MLMTRIRVPSLDLHLDPARARRNCIVDVKPQGFELTGKPGSVLEMGRGIWQSRDLLRMLAKKDFVARYRRASLGMAWAVGLPLVQAVVLAVVLSHLVKFKTNVNFAVFVYTGTLAWNFFSQTLTSTTNSIVE